MLSVRYSVLLFKNLYDYVFYEVLYVVFYLFGQTSILTDDRDDSSQRLILSSNIYNKFS